MKSRTKWRVIPITLGGACFQILIYLKVFPHHFHFKTEEPCCANLSTPRSPHYGLEIVLQGSERSVQTTGISGGIVTFCKERYLERHDLLKLKPPTFLKRFKNPCWLSEDRKFLCLPYFYLIGVAKCGTTDLFKKIAAHPEFRNPSIKEPNWLSNGRFKNGTLYFPLSPENDSSLQHYALKFFSEAAKAIGKSGQNGRNSTLITGEASINTIDGTMYWPLIPQNVGQPEPLVNNPEFLYHINPRTRILITVRNPVDRLWSEYLAFTKDRAPSASKFHNIVERILHVYDECQQYRSLRSCMNSKTLSDYSTMNDSERSSHPDGCGQIPTDIVYLRRGVYHVFIRDYLKVFPRNQILIQRLEDISANQSRALSEVYQFLEMKSMDDKLKSAIFRLGIRNSRHPSDRTKGDMLNKTRQLLEQFYKPHNEELARLLNDSKYMYKYAT